MRKSLFIIFILSLLISCQSQLFISNIITENISNSPSDYSPDSIIVSLVEPFKSDLEEDMSRIISTAPEEMFKQKPESNLINYLSDLLLEEGIRYCRKQGFTFRPQVAYVNYGGIRSSLPKGQITVGNIYELMPFENELVVLEISGEDLLAFAGQIADWGGDGVSGISLGIKDGKVESLKIEGKTPVLSKSYYLITNDYVATGGGGMKSLANHKKNIKTGIKIRDLIISNMEQDYQSGIEISSSKDGRVYFEE